MARMDSLNLGIYKNIHYILRIIMKIKNSETKLYSRAGLKRSPRRMAV
jgi:hypothetical protein